MSDVLNINTKDDFFDLCCSDPYVSMVVEREAHYLNMVDLFNSF
ncbi:unnamed protein product [marine sediment metagenome]|uniref:Uncharacterized protein n=1 Tax=marine sediment metagenome TaxID=412755 RepID=X1VVZ5_9ZZZZ